MCNQQVAAWSSEAGFCADRLTHALRHKRDWSELAQAAATNREAAANSLADYLQQKAADLRGGKAVEMDGLSSLKVVSDLIQESVAKSVHAAAQDIHRAFDRLDEELPAAKKARTEPENTHTDPSASVQVKKEPVSGADESAASASNVVPTTGLPSDVTFGHGPPDDSQRADTEEQDGGTEDMQTDEGAATGPKAAHNKITDVC